MTDYSYIGVGKIRIREAGSANPLIEVGNCSALSLAISEETKELKDYTQAGGGTYNEVRRIQSVEMQLTAHDLSPENLSRVLYGSTTGITGSAVTNQVLGGAYKGGYNPFPTVPAATPAPVIRATNGRTAVTRANTTAYSLNAYIVPATPNDYFYKVTTSGTSGGTVPTFPTTIGATVTDGTVVLTCMGKIIVDAADYVLSAGGVTLNANAGVTDGEPLEADYTTAAQDVVQALTTSGKEYEVVFEGLNEARSGKAVVLQAYRVRLGAAQNLGLIGEDYAALEVSGKLLKDTTKIGANISQYFKVAMVR